MHNYPSNVIFLYHNLKLHKMIEMHSKYDNTHTNRIFSALNCIDNNVNLCMNCMLSTITFDRMVYGLKDFLMFIFK